MHKKIADFPSETLYGSALISHESVASHLLRDLPGVSTDQGLAEVTSEPVVFFDTAGCEFYERADSEGRGDEGSRSNENEATLVKKWVEELVRLRFGRDPFYSNGFTRRSLWDWHPHK
jgi:DNA polymerase alpha-associated DNA helicase A